MKRMLILALSKVCYVSVYHFCERIQQNVQKEGWQTDMLKRKKMQTDIILQTGKCRTVHMMLF